MRIFKDGKCPCLLMSWLGITSFVCQASAAGFVGNGWLGLRLWSLASFSRSFPEVFVFVFCFSQSVFVFPQPRSGSPCLLGDYPSTAGTESICRAPNLLRWDVLKNKCWLNLQRASAKKRGKREREKTNPATWLCAESQLCVS